MTGHGIQFCQAVELLEFHGISTGDRGEGSLLTCPRCGDTHLSPQEVELLDPDRAPLTIRTGVEGNDVTWHQTWATGSPRLRIRLTFDCGRCGSSCGRLLMEVHEGETLVWWTDIPATKGADDDGDLSRV